MPSYTDPRIMQWAFEHVHLLRLQARNPERHRALSDALEILRAAKCMAEEEERRGASALVHVPSVGAIPAGIFPIVRLWKVFILTWSRDHLSRHKPMHPDLPRIVVDLKWWKEARRG